ncbi:MAG: hypothetical protein ACE5G8_11285 [Anaerolineae bacterium]
MKISYNDARNLSAAAARVGALVIGGQVSEEGGHFVVNQTDVTQLLKKMAQKNVVLIISQVEEEVEEVTKTCLTCGRDYTGSECPHCAHVRSRLRG